MNFREEIMLIEHEGDTIQVLAVSIWEGMPSESVRVVPLDQTSDHRFLFVVPDFYVAQMRHRGSFDQFEFAMRQLGVMMLSGDVRLD